MIYKYKSTKLNVSKYYYVQGVPIYMGPIRLLMTLLIKGVSINMEPM